MSPSVGPSSRPKELGLIDGAGQDGHRGGRGEHHVRGGVPGAGERHVPQERDEQVRIAGPLPAPFRGLNRRTARGTTSPATAPSSAGSSGPPNGRSVLPPPHPSFARPRVLTTAHRQAYCQSALLATFSPALPRTLTVQPYAHPLLDHLVVALLVLMREHLTPLVGLSGDAAGLFNYGGGAARVGELQNQDW